MARVSTYLNFPGTTEEAFHFYQSAFGTEFLGPIARFGDMPPDDSRPPLTEEQAKQVLHIELPILAGHVLMGTDAPESMGFPCKAGNNVHINLEPDTRAEVDALFAALSPGGSVEMPPQEMFWGAYFASFTDRYGIGWMLNCAAQA
jgi:PhnB protein